MIRRPSIRTAARRESMEETGLRFVPESCRCGQMVFVSPDRIPHLDLHESAMYFVPLFLSSGAYRSVHAK